MPRPGRYIRPFGSWEAIIMAVLLFHYGCASHAQCKTIFSWQLLHQLAFLDGKSPYVPDKQLSLAVKYERGRFD